MSELSEYAERLKGARAQAAGDGDRDEYRAYAGGRVGTRPQVSVTFRRKDGRGKNLAYSHLYGIDDDNPNAGFTLEFTRHRVAVRGRNLADLHRLLCDHRVRDVQEVDEVHALALAPTDPVVTGIQVTDKQLLEEW